MTTKDETSPFDMSWSGRDIMIMFDRCSTAVSLIWTVLHAHLAKRENFAPKLLLDSFAKSLEHFAFVYNFDGHNKGLEDQRVV